MTDREQKAYENCMMELLPLSSDELQTVISNLMHNDVFCRHCGRGSFNDPNPNCRCWDDE